MNLRKRIRTDPKFRKEWIEAGLDPNMTNKEIKEYLKNLRSDVDSPDATTVETEEKT